jgi:cytochrome c556
MRSITILLAAALLSATASAQEDPIQSRKFLMQSNSAAGKIGSAMAKGEMDFNADAADAVLKNMRAVAFAFGTFIPEQPDAGENTRASPKIWENRADFDAKLAEFQKDAAAAVEAKPQDLEAFKTAFGSVAENCKGCHDEYRLEKKN